MADIYQIYDLPPPPPPTFLSFYNGPDRARLPNFLDSTDPVGAAHQYLHDQIMFLCIPSIWTQVKVVTGLAGLILVAAMAVIIRRLLQRSLWFLRVKATERGPMIIPNAIMVFAAIEGLFVIIFLALLNKIYVAWVLKKEPLNNLILWIVLTWAPLIAGPIWSSFGVWHARPPGSTPRSRGPPMFFGIRVTLPKSIFVSLFWLSIPLMIFFSVLGFAIKGNIYREQGVVLYHEWLQQYSNAPALTRPMLLELQEIWAKDLRAFYWLAIAMLVWFFWTVVLFFTYTYVSFRLLVPLRTQLLALRDRNKRKRDAMTADDRGETTANVTGPEGSGGTKSGGYLDGLKSQMESVRLPLEALRHRQLAANFAESRTENVEFEKGDEDDGVDEHWGVNVKDLQYDFPHKSFFPPVKPSAVVRPATDLETSEAYLSAAYKHFLFQAVTVSVAIVYFSEITMYLALTVYSYNERRILGRAIDIAFLQAMWGSVLFGTGIFVSITLRTYEPMLVNLLHSAHVDSGERRITSARRTSRMLSPISFPRHDLMQSFASSQGASTLVASPITSRKLPSMHTLNRSERTTDPISSPDGMLRSASRNSIIRSTRESAVGPYSLAPLEDCPPRRPSVLRRLSVPDVCALDERGTEGSEPGHLHTAVTTDRPRDDVRQPFYTYQSGLNFLESSSSINDRSLREMPSMSDLEWYASACSHSESNGASDLLDRQQGQQQQQQQQQQDERNAAASLVTIPSLEQRLDQDFVSGLRGASPGSEDERVRAYRDAFVQEVLSKTTLDPPPRHSRPPSRAS